MELTIKKMAFGERPNKYQPDNELYTVVGENGIRQMVSNHYDLLVNSSIKHLFPTNNEGLEIAKKNSADFFVQRLGGPDYFNQNKGKPMLANRHIHFKITPNGRITWLECYREVLLKMDAPESLKMSFWNFLHDFSNWMVNTPEDFELNADIKVDK